MGKKTGRKGVLPTFIPRPPACLKQFAEGVLDSEKVEEEARSIQERLSGILTEVWDENAIFQRIMYKNQNQHRRTVYFRRLLEVRRDLLLLESFSLKDVVEALPHCVSSNQKSVPPKAVLSSLGQGVQSKDQMISTVQRRLLGAARLLQMIEEPILNAGLVIEGLLSQAFFMPFALTVLALLAHFRVLLIKALYELISAFNLVSAVAQKMEISCVCPGVPLLLECKWGGGKLVFFEKARPTPPPEEVFLVPLSLSDAGKLPDAGWFIDDRTTSAQSTGASKPILYEREESFILEDSPFEVLGGEDVVEEVPIPTLDSAVEAKTSSFVHEIAQSSSVDVAGVLPEASSSKQGTTQVLKSDVRAKLESWKAELESWGSKEEKVVAKTPKRKRVAYVSVELGAPKTDSALVKQKRMQDSKTDARAELENWKAELESWGSKEEKVVDKNAEKKRVAYVSVELGVSQESKNLITGHPR